MIYEDNDLLKEAVRDVETFLSDIQNIIKPSEQLKKFKKHFPFSLGKVELEQWAYVSSSSCPSQFLD